MDSEHRSHQRLHPLLAGIAAKAGADVSRAEFLKAVCGAIIEYAPCDRLGLTLRDGDCVHRCEIAKESGDSFRYEADRTDRVGDGSGVWADPGNEVLERLCDDVVSGRMESNRTCTTKAGSLWTGDVSLLPVTGLLKSRSDPGMRIRLAPNCLSLVLIPVVEGSNSIGLMQLTSAARDFFARDQVESLEMAARTLGLAHGVHRLRVAVRERVKELSCLCDVVKLVSRTEPTLDELLGAAVDLLPPAWLHPESTVARIVLGNHAYVTRDYRRPVQSLRADITVFGRRQGYVEVGYVEKKPELDEGPFLVEERHLIDAIARDIALVAEQRQSVKEKHSLQEQLLRADRLATIGQLGADLAHELNEPLANILGFAQLAAKDSSLKDQTRQDIERIAAGALYARDVTAKLLLFARETPIRKTPLDLNLVVADSCHFMESRCSRAGVTVTRRLAEGLPLVPADRSQLLQLLTNLVVNAIQAMANGGQLALETSLDYDHVVLTVEDTGCGMTDEVKKNIFDPFFTTKGVNEGTGLGLSVVHGIVSSHGGTIEVTSEVGRGSCFVVRLPVNGLGGGKE